MSQFLIVKITTKTSVITAFCSNTFCVGLIFYMKVIQQNQYILIIQKVFKQLLFKKN